MLSIFGEFLKNLKFLKFPVGGSRSQGFRKYLISMRILGVRPPLTGVNWEEPSMDQYQCRGNLRRTFRTIGPYEFPQEKKWTNDWSICMSPKLAWTTATQVLWKFQSWPVLVHRVLFPGQKSAKSGKRGFGVDDTPFPPPQKGRFESKTLGVATPRFWERARKWKFPKSG